MAINLPLPISAYFAADRIGDPETLVQYFADDAIVRDERKTYIGRDAIRQWKITSAAKYTYSVDPYEVTDEAGTTAVTAHLSGNFPGSPIDLRYRFLLKADRIAALEIGV